MKLRVNNIYATIYLALAMQLISIGCKKRSTVIELPHGYTGAVLITCGDLRDDSPPITVDANGRADHAPCPHRSMDLTIVRDGQRISPIEVPVWETTGDGIPVSIHFSVR